VAISVTILAISQVTTVAAATLTVANASSGACTGGYPSIQAALSATVNNIPTDARDIYVTLGSLVNGSWTTNSYTYTAF
jgi:hypothetical protein